MLDFDRLCSFLFLFCLFGTVGLRGPTGGRWGRLDRLE